MAKKSKWHIYTIENFNKQGGISTEYDNYAFFHSREYETIEDVKMRDKSDSDLDFDCYVKLEVKGRKPIYLKYHSWNNKKSTVMLSYKNLCRLDAVDCKKQIKKVLVLKSATIIQYTIKGRFMSR